MGIKLYANQAAGPFGAQKEAWKFWVSEKYSSHKPLAWMHWCLVWSILGTRRFKFVQKKISGVI